MDNILKQDSIQKGDIYWLKTESNFLHPHVVIQIIEDEITVCGITTNMKKMNMPGNVVLEKGEGGLEKESIVEVAKKYIVMRSDLGGYIGNLNINRVKEIIRGINFLKKSFLR